ncbi:MAG: transporter [Pirellulales bacterium]|nr:transporter [Pirellulales bacterium]
MALATTIHHGWPSFARAQQVAGAEAGGGEEFETDRDAFTPATNTVAPRENLLESSYSFIDNRFGPESHSVPELLVRHGLTERFELRAGWNYEVGGGGTVSGGEVGGEDFVAEQESRVLYGGKYQLSDQSGWTPRSSLIVQGYTPTSGPSNASTITLGEAWGWEFANGWRWDSAFRFGTGFDEGDYLNQWAPSTVLRIPFGERWNAHAEYFGIMSSHAASDFSHHFASFGGHFLVTPNIELGMRFGFGLNEQSARYFNNVGIGWRF